MEGPTEEEAAEMVPDMPRTSPVQTKNVQVMCLESGTGMSTTEVLGAPGKMLPMVSGATPGRGPAEAGDLSGRRLPGCAIG